MITAYKRAVFENYANFSGRLSVPGYWWYFLANFLIVVALQILAQASSAFFFLALVYGLAVFIPGLAAAVRRLHDTGTTGWLMLISLIPFIGFVVLIVFLARAGDDGSNRYGPRPVT